MKQQNELDLLTGIEQLCDARRSALPRTRVEPEDVRDMLRSRIKAFMKRNGVNQTQMACAAGMASSQLCTYLAGKNNIGLQTTNRLVAALGERLVCAPLPT
ncbi:hypothetical protein LCGC14_1473440 [marine sediment metagenome]|uniref:HTH cro/C1-type domain-containing protein n=1 Tax=marine sediment metagenome TaxID=412755 RepID=A0A0F9MDG1_9ZZZZ